MKHEICVFVLWTLVIVFTSIIILYNRRFAKVRFEFHISVLMLPTSKLELRFALVSDQDKISVRLDGVCLKVGRIKLVASLLLDPEEVGAEVWYISNSEVFMEVRSNMGAMGEQLRCWNGCVFMCGTNRLEGGM